MLFNSTEFALFLVVVLVVFYTFPLFFRPWILLLSSFLFYARAEFNYLFLLLFAISSTFLLARKIPLANPRKRKLFLSLGLFFNIGILVVFKYLGFFSEIIQWLSSFGDERIKIPILSLLLPVGISFFTFQSIGYLLDVYFKVREPEGKFLNYALFIGFFPQLLSGPIGRSTGLLNQFSAPMVFDAANLIAGFQRFIWGLFKKTVIADRLAVAVDTVYNDPGSYTGAALVFATFLFAFQLYTDFSGYTDMAIGTARMFGIRLAENFNFPFISKNITEFWRRWHISLSNWLRDYLYTPILFSKKKWGKKAIIYAIFLTFLICGLWHGASINFVLFGVLQGIMLVFELQTRDKRLLWSTKPRIKPFYGFFSWLITFFLILLSFVFFRANSFNDAVNIIFNGFFRFYDFSSFALLFERLQGSRFIFSLVLLSLFIVGEKRIYDSFVKNNPAEPRQIQLVSFFIGLIILFGVFGSADFIYFKF